MVTETGPGRQYPSYCDRPGQQDLIDSPGAGSLVDRLRPFAYHHPHKSRVPHLVLRPRAASARATSPSVYIHSLVDAQATEVENINEYLHNGVVPEDLFDPPMQMGDCRYNRDYLPGVHLAGSETRVIPVTVPTSRRVSNHRTLSMQTSPRPSRERTSLPDAWWTDLLVIVEVISSTALAWG